MNVWLFTLGSVLMVSLLSFIGVVALRWNQEKLQPVLLILLSFSTGAMLGDVFIHLLPELSEGEGITLTVSLSVLAGIIIFFILEKFIHWRHCHITEGGIEQPDHRQHHHYYHPFVVTNLFGDGLHNFIDGMLIAGSYLISFPVGFATTIAVVLHEIPQEIGDFAVLIHGGLSKKRALFLNFLSATTSILGALLVLSIGAGPYFELVKNGLIAFTAGGFIYIAATDLIPELHKETKLLRSFIQLLGMGLGIVVMLSLLLLE